MSYEYRVIWKRVGLNVKRKRYVFLARAETFAALLTDKQPWVRRRKDPDAYACCSGRECGCGGLTVREEAEARIAEYPALEYVRIERREVMPWTAATAEGRWQRSSE